MPAETINNREAIEMMQRCKEENPHAARQN